MGNWYKDLTSEIGNRYPWIVCYTGRDGETHQEQVSGQSAQDVADYIRGTYHPEHIDYIAKLDDSWK